MSRDKIDKEIKAKTKSLYYEVALITNSINASRLFYFSFSMAYLSFSIMLIVAHSFEFSIFHMLATSVGLYFGLYFGWQFFVTNKMYQDIKKTKERLIDLGF